MSARLPLSEAQRGIWLGQQLDLSSPLYNAAEFFEIEGDVICELLIQAITHVSHETEGLNLRFDSDEGEPFSELVQNVVSIVKKDFSQRSREEAFQWMYEDIAIPMDLTRGELTRHAIVSLPNNKTGWYFCGHHVALDGYGFSMVIRRIAEVYDQLCKKQPISPLPFRELKPVIDEDIQYQKSSMRSRSETFWKEKLGNRSEPMTFCSAIAPMVQKNIRVESVIDGDLFEAIERFAEDEESSWGNALLALFSALLYQKTGNSEITLGLPVMNRLGSKSIKVPCMQMNIIPFPVDINSSSTLRNTTIQIDSTYKECRRHQMYRYEHLRRDLNRVGGSKRLFGPVVNIMPFDFPLTFNGKKAKLSNISAGPVEDLALGVHPVSDGKGVHITLDMNPNSYTEEFAQKLMNNFVHLLQKSVANPDTPLVSNDSLENELLLQGETESEIFNSSDLFTRSLMTVPNEIALIDEDREYTYAELNELILEKRQEIIENRRSSRPVAVMLPRSAEAIATIIASQFAGQGYLPLDCESPLNRIEEIIEDAQPSMIITTEALKEKFPILRTYKASKETTPSSIATAYMMYTSGSTGKPKGVTISQDALGTFITGALKSYELRERERTLQFAPLHFDASVEEIFLTLCSGGTLVLRNDACLESLPAFTTYCEKHQISLLDLPTAFWNELVYALESRTVSLPESITTVIIGGEAALSDKVESWRKAVDPSVSLINTYGPTETTIVATCAKLAGPNSYSGTGDMPIGTPLGHVKTAIVIPESGQPCKPGDAGELWIIGPTLADGYWNRDEEEKRSFIDAPFLPDHPRAYRTGDLVVLGNDSQIYYKGRIDFEFKVSGHRINPQEIENHLVSHEAITEAIVIGESRSNGIKQLVVHLIGNDTIVTPEDLRTYLANFLPEAVLPSQYYFYDSFPTTANGKVDRNALRSQTTTTIIDESTSKTEEVILSIWREILGVESISVQEDFFNLGGQSLQCIQVATRLQVELEREISVPTLFRYPVCRDLAQFLDCESPEESFTFPKEMDDDAELPADIVPCGTATNDCTNVLLTGATGFVGINILYSLAREDKKITVLVRAESAESGISRIQKACRDQAIPFEEISDKLTVIPADLSKPQLGLSDLMWNTLAETTDLIIHNGATVSVVREYQSLRRVNVHATMDLLRLACTEKQKPFHFISTHAVFPSTDITADLTERFYERHEGLQDGYQQSKWMAEDLLRQAQERDIPISIYRLGRVSGSTSTGYVNAQDLVWQILQAGIPAGSLPEIPVQEVWIPVNYVADTVVSLSDKNSDGTLYNISVDTQVDLVQTFNWVKEYGFNIDLQPVPLWKDRVAQQKRDEDQGILAFFDMNSGKKGSKGSVCNRNMRTTLGSEYHEPVLTKEIFFSYLDFAVSQGILPTPQKAGE